MKFALGAVGATCRVPTIGIIPIQISGSLPIAAGNAAPHYVVMAFSETMLSDEDKLHYLRRCDHYREWSSLDDLRYCLWCGKLIRGFEIKLVTGLSEAEPQRVACPTEGCNSIPVDWALPTTQILFQYNAAKKWLRLDGAEFVSHSRS